MDRFTRFVRRLRSNVWVHCALLSSFVGFGVLLGSLPPTVVAVCVGVGVVGLAYHVLLVEFERGRPRPRPLSRLPDWSLFVLPAGGLAGFYLLSHRLSPLRVVLFGALLAVALYFWFVLPAAWYHKVRYDRRDGDLDPPASSLTVLVPAHNEERCIGRCLDSLTRASYPGGKEILVVDDGSTDGTYGTALAHATDEVTVFRKPNGGKDSALNYGLEWATGDAVVTVDADSVVAPDALERIVADLEVSPEVGAVGGTVRPLHTDSLVEKLQALEYAVGINTFRRAFATLDNVTVVPGCLGCFRREALEAVGGYDGDTLTEDYDLTIKLLRAGWSVRASEALSYTEPPATWRDLYRQRSRWSRGNVETLCKHAAALRGRDGTSFSGIVFPYQAVSLVVLPAMTAVVLGTIGAALLAGHVAHVATTLALFALLHLLATVFALVIDGNDLSLAAYAPASMVWYQYFVNGIALKALLDVARGSDRRWTRVSRRPSTANADAGARAEAHPALEAEVSDD